MIPSNWKNGGTLTDKHSQSYNSNILFDIVFIGSHLRFAVQPLFKRFSIISNEIRSYEGQIPFYNDARRDGVR